jgi:hypothetical protein
VVIAARYVPAMHIDVLQHESITQRVFAAWSVAIPASFSQAFLDEDGYWHAWDAHRSVSLTSIALTREGEPATAEMIARELPQLDVTPVDRLPPDLLGGAVEADAPQAAIASRILSGMLVADGRMLIVTITSDDLEWARRTWLSIRCHPIDQATGSTSGPRSAVW